MKEENFRPEEHDIYIEVLDLFEKDLRIDKLEFKREVEGIIRSEEFAEDAINFWLNEGAIVDEGNNYRITNNYNNNLEYTKIIEEHAEKIKITSLLFEGLSHDIKTAEFYMNNIENLLKKFNDKGIKRTIEEWGLSYQNGDKFVVDLGLITVTNAFFNPEETKVYKKFFSEEEYNLP